MTGERILVVDDDPQILQALRIGLRGKGFEVLTAPNGETALDILATDGVDVVILDLGLPGIGGHEVVERVRGWSSVPVVVLSAREDQTDKVKALDAGADDYVTKPFAMEELLARIRALRRRAGGEERTTRSVLVFGDLRVDLSKRSVHVRERAVRLTPTEHRLLEALVTHPGRLLTHRWLLERVWGAGYGEESEGTLRVFIRQLRSKLGDRASSPTWIGTEAGLGYRWLTEPSSED
ncbi:MAG TPA: response regulator transcription factor [Actinomycetota bacterium]